MNEPSEDILDLDCKNIIMEVIRKPNLEKTTENEFFHDLMFKPNIVFSKLLLDICFFVIFNCICEFMYVCM